MSKKTDGDGCIYLSRLRKTHKLRNIPLKDIKGIEWTYLSKAVWTAGTNWTQTYNSATYNNATNDYAWRINPYSIPVDKNQCPHCKGTGRI